MVVRNLTWSFSWARTRKTTIRRVECGRMFGSRVGIWDASTSKSTSETRDGRREKEFRAALTRDSASTHWTVIVQVLGSKCFFAQRLGSVSVSFWCAKTKRKAVGWNRTAQLMAKPTSNVVRFLRLRICYRMLVMRLCDRGCSGALSSSFTSGPSNRLDPCCSQ